MNTKSPKFLSVALIVVGIIFTVYALALDFTKV